MTDILLSTYNLILLMDITGLIKNLPLELQWEIGQYLGLYFPLSKESSKSIINETNYQRYMNHALQGDNVGQLITLLQFIAEFSDIKELTVKCAKFGALECLKYLTEHDFYKHQDVTFLAAQNGNLACLQYLTRQGYDKHEYATWAAAESGHLACLQYLTEQGYPKHPNATCGAAINGHLACLKYMTEQDYHKDPYAIYLAHKYGHLECLRYLNEH